MTRMAVFGGASLKRRLRDTARGGLEYEFHPLPAPRARLELDPERLEGALLEVGKDTRVSAVKALRRALPAHRATYVNVKYINMRA